MAVVASSSRWFSSGAGAPLALPGGVGGQKSIQFRWHNRRLQQTTQSQRDTTRYNSRLSPAEELTELDGLLPPYRV